MNSIKKYILLFFAACIAMAACVKEDMNIGESADGLVTFRAMCSDVDSGTDTKTVLNNLAPYWTPSDSITVYDGVINSFKANLSVPSDTADFTGKLEGKGRSRFMAVSPYSDKVTFSALSPVFYGLSVPQHQTCLENTYDPSAQVSVAYTTSYDLEFKNVCALVKFKIVSDGVTSVTLKSNGEEVLSGTFEATCADTPTVSVGAGKNEVVLSGSFKKSSTYYLVTVPAALKTGFTITLKDSAGKAVESLNYGNRVNLKRSAILDVGELSLEPQTQTPDGGDDDGEDGKDEGGEEDGDNNDDSGSETEVTIYLHPNSNWKEADARFAAYFFESEEVEWVNMTDADGDGNYECAVPSGKTNLIFVRMDPATTDNNWENKWNQSGNLEVPKASSTSICYVIKAGEWEGDNIGYWTTYPPVIEDQPDAGGNTGGNTGGNAGSSPAKIYLDPWQWISDGARIEAYFFGGSGDAWATMTLNNGLYECEVPAGHTNVVFVRMDPAKPEHNWDSKWNQTVDETIPTDGKNKYTIKTWDGGADGKSTGTWSVK